MIPSAIREGKSLSPRGPVFDASTLQLLAARAFGNESIPGVANREKVPGLGRIGLEDLPQPADELVGARVLMSFARQSPDVFQQLAAGNHSARVLDEIAEQRQLHLASSGSTRLWPATSKVSKSIFAPANSNLSCDCRGGRAALASRLGERQQISHAADELVQVEWLAHVLVRTDVEAPRAVFGQRPGAEDQHRHVPIDGPERLADGVPAHAGQHQVEHHQIDVGGRIGQQFDRRPAIPA